MKKSFLSVMCLLVGFHAFAQDYPQNEISVTYGGISLPCFAVGVAGIFGSVIAGSITDGEVVAEDMSTSGNYSAQYYYNINAHFGFGAELVYERCSLTFTGQRPSVLNFVTIMPSVKGRWFQAERFGMYSRASVGICATAIPISQWVPADDPVQAGFAFHVAPFGMAFGSRDLKVIAEVGLGMGPLASIGAVYSF